MKNLSVGKKMILSFGIIFVLISLFFTYVTLRNRSVAERYKEVIEKYGEINLELAHMNADSSRAQAKVAALIGESGYTSEQAETKIKEFESIESEIAGRKKTLDTLITDADMLAHYKTIKSNMDKEKTYVNSIISAVQGGNHLQAKQVYENDFSPVSEENDALINKITELSQSMTETMTAKAEKLQKQIEMNICGGMIIVLIAIAVVAGKVVKNIRRPLIDMEEGIKKLAKGDVDIHLTKWGNDEIGVVVDAVNELAEKNKQAAEIASLISDGDLTMDVSPKTAEDVLGNSLKRMVDGNNATLSEIREAAEQVGSGASQVATASQSLAQGSTEQASAIQEVTASITDITERTRLNAEDADKASELVLKTKENATRGNEEMGRMVAAMGEISEASENIFKIIKTIDDIAFQTNILALNASVEAARAGEHGKGFAVVAEEVRALAAKSTEAASETAAMIEDSMEKAKNGSELAERTANELKEIESAVDDIVELIQEIATASNNQATALTQIDQAVSQVSQVVQTNSATSEECAAASEELSNQAKNLKVFVNKYRLRAMASSQAASFGADASYYQEAPKQDTTYQEAQTQDASYQSSSASQGASTSYQSSSSYQSDSSSYQGTTSYQSGTSYQEPSYGQSSGSMGSAGYIPDASDFADQTNAAANEQIISLEDNGYSKY